jgi:hypothetical protein
VKRREHPSALPEGLTKHSHQSVMSLILHGSMHSRFIILKEKLVRGAISGLIRESNFPRSMLVTLGLARELRGCITSRSFEAI